MGIILSKGTNLRSCGIKLELHDYEAPGGWESHAVVLTIEGTRVTTTVDMDMEEWHKVLVAISGFDTRTAIIKARQQDADEDKCTDCGEFDCEGGIGHDVDPASGDMVDSGIVSDSHQAYVKTMPDMAKGPRYSIRFISCVRGAEELTGEWSGSRELAIQKMHELIEAGAVMER
jgi:hypothetical protein